MIETSVILINYNGWSDSIDCLQSLKHSSHLNFNVFLIDNGSELENFESYLLRIKSELIFFKKIIVISEGTSSERISLSKKYFEIIRHPNELDFSISTPPILFLFFNEKNVGFAAGNNKGIQFAGSLNTPYYWLLNNDTLVDKNALSALLNFAKRIKEKTDHLGLIGSKVLHYNNPTVIQTVGGIFNKFTSRQHHKGYNETDKGQFDFDNVRIDYPYGASIFFDHHFLNEIGYMNEKYFLYFEEIDWAVRAKRKGYETKLCYESKIFHKQGSSTGIKLSNSKSPFFIYLTSRNLLLFYKQYYFYLLPVAWFHLLFLSLKSMIKLDWNEAVIILKVLTRIGVGFLEKKYKL